MAKKVLEPSVHEAQVQAMLQEARAFVRRLEILSDPEFVEGGRIGIEQERQGLGVPLAEVRRRYTRGS